jgi:hypothetical protein
MASPQVVDGGNGLKILSRAAKILNKVLQTVDSEWSSSFGVGQGTNTPTPKKKQCVTKHFTQVHWKMDMSFGMWNVRSLWSTGSLKIVERELGKFELDLVGV